MAKRRAKQPTKSRRDNQRRRTRKDLLSAAAELMRSGQTPDMDQVAEGAMVSRATAYRYFPTVEALLSEALVDEAVPDSAMLFESDRTLDPVARVDKAETALHEVCYRYAGPLRAMLAASVAREVNDRQTQSSSIPKRQNRRTGLIESALAPVKNAMTADSYQKLCASLALVFGTESMIVFQDVLRMNAKDARHVKRWMIESLVRSALNR